MRSSAVVKPKPQPKRKHGAEHKRERDIRAATWIGAVMGPFYELLNDGLWFSSGEAVRARESRALALVQKYARELVIRLCRDGDRANLEAVDVNLPTSGESDSALLAAFDARHWATAIALHLRDGNRWKRLRKCDECRRWFYARHLNAFTCSPCRRSR